jgi:hypothetical protein
MLSLVLAVLAALGNATASVLQRKANRDEPVGQAAGLALFWHLVHHPAWLGESLRLSSRFCYKPPRWPPGRSLWSSRSLCWSCHSP